MIELRFSNTQATPKNQTIQCSDESVQLILHWYFGFYSGDDIEVYRDGKRMKLNQYGDILP